MALGCHDMAAGDLASVLLFVGDDMVKDVNDMASQLKSNLTIDH